MDIEQKQAEHIENFVKQASIIKGSSSALANVIVEATSHPSLFAFSEILAVPNIIELQGTEHSIYLDLLQMFAHGTWSEYKSNASNLPQLTRDQVLKLKQLTMLTLAEANKVLPYDVLMHELDVVNVRELEDFLINECMLGTSDNLLISIQEKIKWADTMSELDKKHKKENEERLEEVKNALSLKADMDFRGHGIFSEPGGVMDYDEDRRSKRRRHPMG
ncbi:hypothetical protein Ccrd_000725 [Cynara cardunculus var. scolymus]|uniref:PCI domain-containing protein n=1 Tax=Cynara cardunculus var. scolymus TaxID=59895 RepID=A0A103XUL8_CYNCS|nr:hypothetical protein Ccrd_000725 [Cynara cardunculus var. scolymus]